MKKTITGCTGILSGAILYGLRYIAAAILMVENAVKGGNTDIGQALTWLGSGPLLVSIFLLLIGIVFIVLGLLEKP